MTVTRTEALEAFLQNRTTADLGALYDAAMEVQVMVHGADDEKFEDVTADGRRFRGYRDALTGEVWKDFRIPHSDGTYEDQPMTFALDTRAEAIGLTGWDWQAGVSRWVGFDFDSLVGHKKGLTDAQLQQIVEQVSTIPWVTVRRSRSGRGIHLYVFLDPAVETANRAEHAALARAILQCMSAACGGDLKGSVDVLGCVLWVWHREVKAGGLSLIKQGVPLEQVPENWRDHLSVTRDKAMRSSGDPILDDLIGLTRQVPLDAEHKRLLAWFSVASTKGANWWWDADRHMLVCHTSDLKVAHGELKLRGVFYTTAASAAYSGHQNCFAFPMRNGGWMVRRHGHGTAEHATWTRDAAGWTRCVFGRPAELRSVAPAYEGLESARGEFVFRDAKRAFKALSDLGVDTTQIPQLDGLAWARTTEIAQHDQGRLVVRVERDVKDNAMAGWLCNKRGTHWELLVKGQAEADGGEPPDDLVRHVVAGGKDAGWFLHARGSWVNESRQNVTSFLLSQGTPRGDIEPTLGQAIGAYWEMVNQPFAGEYPGNRQWNKFGARLAVTPQEGPHPTWNAVLSHTGHGLTKALKENAWAKKVGCLTGSQYLLWWTASLFQFPLDPLAYLAIHGPQRCGKSTFHEALSLFFAEGRGYIKADVALTSVGRFNAELAGAVLCVVEETNLRANKGAYDRIKDWVTGRHISIHEKGCTPYDLKNSCHWIQCSNHANHTPVLPGDTRITMIAVEELMDEVPKPELMNLLQAEAPAFLNTLLNTRLPPMTERLRVPAVDTADKEDQMDMAKSDLELFAAETLAEVPGCVLSFADFFERFHASLPDSQKHLWTSRRVGREFAHPLFPKGRYGAGGQIHLGNCTWVELAKKTAPDRKLVRQGDRLVRL